MHRLGVPTGTASGSDASGLREVGWSQFGELTRELAKHIGAAYSPEVILGVVNGGVFLGGALAIPLHAAFQSVRVSKLASVPVPERLPSLAGKRVLVVDDVTASGRTLRAVCAAATKAGARETRTATLVVRPDRNQPDFFALDTEDLVVFPWDYQLNGRTCAADDPGEVGV